MILRWKRYMNLNKSSHRLKLGVPQTPLLYFWTPEYWYRPRPIQDCYMEYIEHLTSLRNYIAMKRAKKKHRKKKFNDKLRLEDEKEFKKIFDNTKKFNKHQNDRKNESNSELQITSVQYIREILKMKVALRVVDFDSSTLAYQLTMIDRDLFMKIPESELQVIIWQHNSKNIPNIGTLIAFSHRICCLVATEILREEALKNRARLIVRFINIATRCEKLNNFQSCISILNGLQSAPIYRLHNTWAYIRKYYSMKYLAFENLCRHLTDPRLPCYQKIFYLASKEPPFLPYIGDILIRLMGRASELSKKELKQIDNAPLYSPVLQENGNNFQEMMIFSNKLEQRKCKDNVNKYPRTRRTKPNRILHFFSYMKLWKKSKENSKMNHHRQRAITPRMKAVASEKSKLEVILRNNNEKIRISQLPEPYEDNRLERLQETTQFLNMCQKAATKYALNSNDLAKEYLLKARYREDRENFFISFKLESKITFLNT